MGTYLPQLRPDLEVGRAGAALRAPRLYEPQPISNRPMGVGYPHLAGRYVGYGPGGLPFCPRFVGVADI